MRLPGRTPRADATLERDLARLADGTLHGPRRERVEQLVARSPELQARLREQRRAVAAARSLADHERAPITLHLQHQALAGRQSERRRSPAVRLGLGLGLAGAAGALLWTVAAAGRRPGRAHGGAGGGDRTAARHRGRARATGRPGRPSPACASTACRSPTGRIASAGTPPGRALIAWTGGFSAPCSTAAGRSESPTRSSPARRSRRSRPSARCATPARSWPARAPAGGSS